MIVSDDGEVRLIPIEDGFPAELETIYQAASEHFGGFDDKGAAVARRGLCPGEGEKLDSLRPENLEHLAIAVGTVTVGYMTVYRDFPYKSYVEVVFMYIASAARCMDNGRRAIEAAARYFYESGYASMRVCVGIDERDALRFFYRCGFVRPLAFVPEGELREDDFVGLTLERPMPGGVI